MAELKLRVPDGLKDALERRAKAERRSMNFVAVEILRVSLGLEDPVLLSDEEREFLRPSPMPERPVEPKAHPERAKPAGCEHKNRRLLNGGLKRCDDCDTTWK